MEQSWTSLSKRLRAEFTCFGEKPPEDHDKVCETILDESEAAVLFRMIPTVLLKRALTDTCVYMCRLKMPVDIPFGAGKLSSREDVLRACLQTSSANSHTSSILLEFLNQRLQNSA